MVGRTGQHARRAGTADALFTRHRDAHTSARQCGADAFTGRYRNTLAGTGDFYDKGTIGMMPAFRVRFAAWSFRASCRRGEAFGMNMIVRPA